MKARDIATKLRALDLGPSFTRVDLLWRRLRANHYPSFYSSHSQFGEDMVLRALTMDRREGFYVDIGAHHPFYLSNTFHFYSKGWRGLNVDAMPGSMDVFRKLRPRDISVEACIAESSRNVTFHVFDKSAFNTIDPAAADAAVRAYGARLVARHTLTTLTLGELLARHVPSGQTIDFLNIDVEGADLAVLRSNDWERYKPRVIVFESHDAEMGELGNSEAFRYLATHGYRPVAFTGPSLFAALETWNAAWTG